MGQRYRGEARIMRQDRVTEGAQQSSQEPSSKDRSTQQNEAFKSLVHLWSAENSVKTAKLQFYGVISSILAAALTVGDPRWPVAVAGAAFSLVWLFSIGRTMSFQDGWKDRMREIWETDKDHPLYSTFFSSRSHAWYGVVPADIILLGTPAAGGVVWASILIALLVSGSA